MQVDETVDQAQLHVQARIGHQEIGDCRRQVTAAKGRWGIDADQAFRGTAQRNGLGAGQAQLFENAPGAFGEGIAGRGGAYGMGAAGEQAATDGALQVVDAPSHGGRGQWMAASRSRKAPALQHIKKQAQLVGQGIGVHGHFAFARNA